VTLVRERFGQSDREREQETAMTQLAMKIDRVAGRADIQQRKSTRAARGSRVLNHHRRSMMNAIAYELAVARTADLLLQAEHRRMVRQVKVATHQNGSRSTHTWRPRIFPWWNRDRSGSEAASVRA
jgi:hypothetical protein